MEYVASILNGNNASIVLLTVLIVFIILTIGAKFGMFSFKGKGLKVGHTEEDTRALLVKQKDYVIRYCNQITERILIDMNKQGINLEYFKIDYVVEKMLDVVLGWLLFNHVSTDKDYMELKVREAEMVVFKNASKINHELLKDENAEKYFKNICRTFTEEIIDGLLKIKKTEGF
jgi:hypothetical protein